MIDARTEVLLVEDNEDDVFLLSMILNKSAPGEFEIRSAEMLSDALRIIGDGAADVVVTDLSLPDSDGLGVIRKIRERAPHMPIVVMSGLEDDRMAAEARREGAYDYLVKGHVEPEELVRTVRRAAARGATQHRRYFKVA